MSSEENMSAQAKRRARASSKPGQARVNNRDRIVDTAIRILNDRGEENVGTAHIAQALGISPGNLYYHYANRDEIVRAIFPRIEAGLIEALTPPTEGSEPEPNGARILARHYLGGLRTMYQYRFFFCGLPQLVRNDQALREAYLKLEAECLALIRKVVEASIANGSPAILPSDQDLEHATTNTWLVFLSWLNFVCLRKPSSEVSDEDVRIGFQHVFAVLSPWLDAAYRDEASQALDELFRADLIVDAGKNQAAQSA